jgi:hypothetical protein
MLIALGFTPMKAVAVALVANTAPVASGAMATPVITLASVTGLPKEDLGARRRGRGDDLAAEPRDRRRGGRARRPEGTIFRKIIGWSLFPLLPICVIVYLQSTSPFDWMAVSE